MTEEKTINDIGTLTGKLLFFGGVYSNLQSLEALKKWAVENGFPPSSVFCTGDILGYCAQPVECIRLIRDWGIQSIAGNVELQLRNNKDDCGCDFRSGGQCDRLSQNWYSFTKSRINHEALGWLQTLPHHIRFTYAEKRFLLVHGSWFHTSAFIFKSTPWPLKEKNFEAANVDVIIAGHCGLPFADVQDNRYWINAGVIGMPANDGTDRVWFVTVEQESNEGINVHFHHYTYNNQETSTLMQRNGLPVSYANTLQTGIWDNCEILPPEETLQQGKMLAL